MRDGHKEAAKELMSTFRLVVSAALAIFVLFANLQIRGFLRPTHPWLVQAGLVCAALSSLLCCWLFLVVVRMLHRDYDAIVYRPQVLVIGGLALLLFAASIVLIMTGQM